MPDNIDPVEFLFPPDHYPVWWLVAAVFVVLAIIGWVAGVLIWTLPVEKLRKIAGISSVTNTVLARKFTRSLDRVQEQHRAGALPSREACHEISRIFRQYMAFRTGYTAREMNLSDLANTPLAAQAHRVLQTTYLGQFNVADPRLVDAAADAAKSAVAAWA